MHTHTYTHIHKQSLTQLIPGILFVILYNNSYYYIQDALSYIVLAVGCVCVYTGV